jgi:thiamine-monophosphate kinase
MTVVPLGPGPEFDRIRAIARTLGGAAGELGDDCAFLPSGAETICLSIDTSIEGIHFDRAWLRPEEIGWRAAAAALSDLAAVGAGVDGVLAAISTPRDEPETLLVELMRGVGEAVAAVGGKVLGGDLSAGALVTVAVTVVGRTARPVRRSGARPGDAIWLSGTLGGSRAALRAWRNGAEPEPDARRRFARPEPRIALGQWLAERGARAMLDLSDGLAGDARHLARASGVGLEIDLGRLPIGPGVADAARLAGESEPVFAARGGEDYELLVALRPAVDGAVAPGGVPLTRVGRVVEGEGVRLLLEGRPIEISGYDHFR